MDGKEVRGLSDEEIGAELKRLRARLFTLGTQAVTEKVEDNSQFGKVRKDIARLLTERTRRAGATRAGAAGEGAQGAGAPAGAATGGKRAGKRSGGKRPVAARGKSGGRAKAGAGSKSSR